MSTELVPQEDVEDAEVIIKKAVDHRTDAVAQLLASAYGRASTLTLTHEEAAGLAADFPDNAFRLGAGGNDDLLYIEHAFLRERMNQVLGVGSAVPVVRRMWSKAYEYTDKNKRKQSAVRVYVESVLLVRGCVVGEAIGDGIYYKSNGSNTYTDAIESAKSNALRRCCKEFGVGLQVWKKGFVEAWKQRNSRGPQPSRPQPPPPCPAQAPRSTSAVSVSGIFEPPSNWPDTAVHDIKAWIDRLRTAPEFKVCFGLLTGNVELTHTAADWSIVLHHFKDAYKAKYPQVGSAEMNAAIKAALDRLATDQPRVGLTQPTEHPPESAQVHTALGADGGTVFRTA